MDRRAFLRAHGRRIAQVAIIVGAGAAIGLLVVPPAPEGPDRGAKPPEVLLLGEKLPVGAAPAGKEPGAALQDRALEIVRRYAAGSITLRIPGGASREVSRAQLGAEIDKVYLAALLAEARDPTSPMRRDNPPDAALKLPSAVVVNTPRALSTLLTLKDELDRLPSDARLDLASRKLVPELAGYRLDVYATLSRIDEAFRKGTSQVEAVGEVVRPTVLAKELGDVNFEDVLGYFETRYTADQKHEARTYNLRLAASRLDGHIVPPGQVFDFNKIVGPRNEAAGYKVAPVIAQGELVDGIGGGTCQITGTLHGAVFFGGLEILNRTPHTRPSGYIKMGLDAAVAYPTINFRFKNPFPFPVVVHETVKDGVVRAEVLGPKRRYTVTFVRRIDDVTAFQEVDKPDPRLPEGARVLGQRGIPGFKLHRYRIVRDGPFAVREQWNDTYPPTSQVIRVGTGSDLPRDMTLPPDDAHPEYVADEFLSVTQGPGITSSRGPGDMIETREPGRTGLIGWTEKEGMSHWDAGKRSHADDAEGSGKRTRKGDDSSRDSDPDRRSGSVASEPSPGRKRRKRPSND